MPRSRLFWLAPMVWIGSLALGCWPAVYGQEPKQAKVAYEISGQMQQDAALLRAMGLLAMGKDDADLGRKADIRVSSAITVAGAPVEFLQKSADAALVQIAAQGLAVDLPDAGALEKAIADKTIDPWSCAQSLAAWWTSEILAQTAAEQGKTPTFEELLRIDAQRTRSLQSLDAAAQGDLTAEWLLYPGGLDLVSPLRRVRRPVSFQMLLRRFDPAAPVTRENAAVAAEELVWTHRYRLSDGRFATLPAARRRLQAAILARMGVTIGDPGHADRAQREDALKKLAAALKTATQTWKAGKE